MPPCFSDPSFRPAGDKSDHHLYLQQPEIIQHECVVKYGLTECKHGDLCFLWIRFSKRCLSYFDDYSEQFLFVYRFAEKLKSFIGEGINAKYIKCVHRIRDMELLKKRILLIRQCIRRNNAVLKFYFQKDATS